MKRNILGKKLSQLLVKEMIDFEYDDLRSRVNFALDINDQYDEKDSFTLFDHIWFRTKKPLERILWDNLHSLVGLSLINEKSLTDEIGRS